jgi:aspartate-semialdehyde dehydrogenase
VGQEFIKILEQRDFPLSSVHLFASDRSVGKKLFINHREIELKELTPHSFDPVDIALFSAGNEVSQHFVPIAVKRGAVVIDNSGAFAMNDSVPLVVPEVNPEDLEHHRGLIANPNSSTIYL